MMESSSHHPDRYGGARHSPDAFDLLVAQPSLARLAGRGSELDRLPVISTGCVLLANLFVWNLVIGVAGGVLVVVMALLPLVLTALLVRDREVHAGQLTLRLVRGFFVGWMVVAVGIVPAPSLEGPSPWSEGPAVHGHSTATTAPAQPGRFDSPTP